MARPIYEFELTDPDFTWLINQYQERCENAVLIGNSSLPMVFIHVDKQEASFEELEVPYLAAEDHEDTAREEEPGAS